MSEPTPYPPGRWPVHGHRWAVAHLAKTLAAEGDGPRHAYLFLGPRQIGKSTFVRAFATALLCTGERPPCGQCRSCRLIARGAHPDVHTVSPLDRPPDDKAQGAKVAKVDRLAGTLYREQARQIVHDVQLSPVEGRSKLFHIQDAQAANEQFFNALLKTLEEPPARTVFCLTATDRSAILPTIQSRCQVIELHPLDRESVKAALRSHWKVEAGLADLLARLANGRLGWAVDQVQHPELLQERAQKLALLWGLMQADRVERLAQAEVLAARSAQLFTTLDLWASWGRDLLLAQAGCADACANIDYQPVLQQQAQALSAAEVQAFLRTLQRIETMLQETTVSVRLALDTLLLRLPRLASI